MSTQILKFTLKILPYQIVMLPIGTQILSVDFQDDKLQMWAQLDGLQLHEERVINVYGTGEHIYTDQGMVRDYVGTAQNSMGFIYHVFELIET